MENERNLNLQKIEEILGLFFSGNRNFREFSIFPQKLATNRDFASIQ